LSLSVLRKILSSKLANIIGLISVVMLFSEGCSYHLYLKNVVDKNKNIFHQDIKLTNKNIDNIDFSEYQAIVPMPFYYHYIALHGYESTNKSENISMQLSYKTGLPLMSAILSRPSVIESKNILQIFIPSYYQKTIKNDINKKPLLILFSKEEINELQNQLKDKSIKIFEDSEFELYRLEVDSIFKFDKDKYLSFVKNKITDCELDEQTELYFKEGAFVYYESYDNSVSKETYRGEGAFEMVKNNRNLIYRSKKGDFNKDNEYSISFWYYNYIYDQTFTMVWYEIKDSLDNIIEYKNIDPVKSNVYDGNWAYNELTFKTQNLGDYIELYVEGSKLFSDKIYIDELLIMHKDTYVYSIDGEINNIQKLIVNNERIF
jgi:hypothetical protein